MKKLFYLGILFLLSSCAPPVMKSITRQLPPLEENADVTVYKMGDTVPEHSEVIGGIMVRQNNSDWNTLLETAKKEARAMGGNGLELQTYLSEGPTFHVITAGILNINDSLVLAEPEPFDRVDFNDYFVTKDNDTIPCLIFQDKNKSDGFIDLVFGYNRLGNPKALRINKKDLISYHVDDPVALEDRQKKSSKVFIHQKLFTVQFAVDYGVQHYFDPPIAYLMSGKIRFQSNHKFTVGVNYDYSNKPGDTKPGNHFIAGSIGFSGVSFSRPKRTQLDQILGCGCDKEREPLINNRYYLDFLVGYYIGNQLFGNSYLGIGCAIGYDHMISNHFGIGIELSGYPITTKTLYGGYSTQTVVFNLKTGLRYYL